MAVLHKEYLLGLWLANRHLGTSTNDHSLSTRVCEIKTTSMEDVFTATRRIKSAIQSDLLAVLRALPLEVHGE